MAICKLKEEAYGVPIREQICEYTGSDVGYGALYNQLEQLVRKGYVYSERGEPTARRGGKAKVYYRITPEGINSLEKARSLHNRLWVDTPDALADGWPSK